MLKGPFPGRDVRGDCGRRRVRSRSALPREVFGLSDVGIFENEVWWMAGMKTHCPIAGASTSTASFWLLISVS